MKTRTQAQGREAIARGISALEYRASRKRMRTSGFDAALRGLFTGYGQRVRNVESGLPGMLPTSGTMRVQAGGVSRHATGQEMCTPTQREDCP